jgi:AcrR family transcriptional regulator
MVTEKNTMDVRERIIGTASRLFYLQGYNSTGINQVIKEADVAKASLYQHFTSKEDLLVEYLKRAAQATEEGLNAAVSKARSPRAKALAMFEFLAETIAQPAYNGCNFLNVASEIPKNNTKIKTLIRKQKDSIRNMFADILKPANKQQLADELYILFDAALIASKVHGSAWPVKSAKKIAEKII